MTRLVALLGACTLAGLTPGQGAFLTANIQLPATIVVTGVLSSDIDGDGQLDLVLACRDTTDQRRELRLHLRKQGDPCFGNEPSQPPQAIEKDVIAFTYADCDPSPGRELVLLTTDRAVAKVPQAAGEPRYVPLFAPQLVWPAPELTAALPLPGACGDFDGDGRDDLLVPEPEGALLHRHGRAANDVLHLRLPPWRSNLAATSTGGPATLSNNQLNLDLRFAGDDADPAAATAPRDRGPLLSLRTRAPQFRSLDRDGDGKLDLVALRNGQLWTWQQTANGDFAAPRAIDLPLPGDRLALFDPAFDVQLVRVDGDARPDLVLTTSARQQDEIEVRIDLFRTRDDGSWPTKPDRRLRMQTLAKAPQLVDADGDGHLDLVALTMRTDRLKGLTGDAPTALEVQLNVFRGNGETFATPAATTQLLQLPIDGNRSRGPFLDVLPGRAGEPGAALLQSGKVLQRRPFRRDGERLQLAPAAAELALGAAVRLRGLDHTDGTPSGEVVVWLDHEVQHVRMP